MSLTVGDGMRRRSELPPWQQPGEACRLVLTATTAPISGPVAAVVGTVLTAVNQGAVLLEGKVGAASMLRIVANYAIPYCVSSYSALSAVRCPPTARCTQHNHPAPCGPRDRSSRPGERPSAPTT